MGIPDAAFVAGDVYIDYPYEEVFFRFEQSTGKIYRQFYGEPTESEIERSSKLYAEARTAGDPITRSEYLAGKPRRSAP